MNEGPALADASSLYATDFTYRPGIGSDGDMQQLAEPKPEASYARWFSALWFGLGLAILLAAMAYSWSILHYVGSFPAESYIGVFGDYSSSSAISSVYLSTKDGRLAWTLSPALGSTKVIVNRNSDCKAWQLGATRDERPNSITISDVKPFSLRTGDTTLGTLIAGPEPETEVVFDHPTGPFDRLDCTAPDPDRRSPRVGDVSYTRRAIRFGNFAGIGSFRFPGLGRASVIKLTPQFNAQEAVEIRGAPSEGGYVALNDNQAADIEYTDGQAESRRDLALVAIGAAIALGSAMMLESLRPMVEACAEKMAKRTEAGRVHSS